MKEIKKISRYVKHVTALLLLSLLQIVALAQDAGVDIKVTKESSSTWYTQPWVWIVGGAVFILLLVALLRGSGNKN
jgi:hypothetical protein